MRKPYGYWTKEKCQEEALKYKTKKDFKKSGAYTVALKNGFLDEICIHMIPLHQNNWTTKEQCRIEALKYKNKSDFHKKSCGAYVSALKNNWLDDICSHMIEIKKPNGYWTYKRCKEEALKYNTKSEYKIKSKSSYNKSLYCGWLDEICLHMKSIGNKYNRCIYAYEFSDNYVYVGLTCNLEKFSICPISSRLNCSFSMMQ